MNYTSMFNPNDKNLYTITIENYNYAYPLSDRGKEILICDFKKWFVEWYIDNSSKDNLNELNNNDNGILEKIKERCKRFSDNTLSEYKHFFSGKISVSYNKSTTTLYVTWKLLSGFESFKFSVLIRPKVF